MSSKWEPSAPLHRSAEAQSEFQQWPLSSWHMLRETEEMHGFNLSGREADK